MGKQVGARIATWIGVTREILRKKDVRWGGRREINAWIGGSRSRLTGLTDED